MTMAHLEKCQDFVDLLHRPDDRINGNFPLKDAKIRVC